VPLIDNCERNGRHESVCVDQNSRREVNEVVRSLRKVDGVIEAHMTFGPYDAVAEIETKDVTTLGAITASIIQPISGVEQTLTGLAVDI
jgi:DNA-binding Lrp family transcriptional regulator